MYPVTEEMKQKKAENDAAIRSVFTGESDKFILVIGPCSADREDAVLDYISRLRTVQDKVKDKIIIIPRIYTNKPRTTGVGYKGMLHQSDPNASPDMLRGLMAIRRLHVKSLAETGFSGADEMLYPENHRYLADVLSYVAVGARSVENQQHRLTASGLDMPVGMKNPTSGDLSVMVNAIKAAQTGHVFSYGGWEVESKGNPLAHAVLRGWVNQYGQSFPNYHYEDLSHLSAITAGSGQPHIICPIEKYISTIKNTIDVIRRFRRTGVSWSRSASSASAYVPPACAFDFSLPLTEAPYPVSSTAAIIS